MLLIIVMLTKTVLLVKKEFVKNKDWDEVKKTIYDSLVPKEAQKAFGEDGTRKYISESYKDVSIFLNRIKSATGK